ncbi:sn-glycerol-3-phosphate import ATP-binding protein UgpC [Rhodovibrionaceae bacterium A322]
MATVSLKDTRKIYPNGFAAIHGVDLDIADGEFIVLVGPSGCGKSTLLRMVAGLETISQGDLFIDDQRVNEVEPMARDIAMVFQNYALYPHMSVYDNMAYGLKNRKFPKAEIDEKVRESAAILEIEPLLDRRPNQLSGGQRQRVAMGRAIVRHPKVFLFDEPLSNLDAKLRVQMRLEIKKLQKRLGTTSIYVTHDQVEAMTMADRLVVLNGGNVEQIGTPIEVYDRPLSRFVASFIGSPPMNFMRVHVANGQVLLKPGARELARLQDTSVTGLDLGVRPEHLEVCAAGEEDLLLRVEVAESLGADTLLHGSVEGVTDDLVIRLAGYQVMAPGTELPVKLDHERMHFFDAETGQRVE